MFHLLSCLQGFVTLKVSLQSMVTVTFYSSAPLILSLFVAGQTSSPQIPDRISGRRQEAHARAHECEKYLWARSLAQSHFLWWRATTSSMLPYASCTEHSRQTQGERRNAKTVLSD